MKYHVDFQFKGKAAVRPSDDGTVLPIAFDSSSYALIPSVGDYVDIQHRAESPMRGISGIVKSRLFIYMDIGDLDGPDVTHRCIVNIVVEEVADAVFGTLIKE